MLLQLNVGIDTPNGVPYTCPIMTITQTIAIPASRKVCIEVALPESFAPGNAKVAMRFTPTEEEEGEGEKKKFRIPILSWLEDRRIRKNGEAIRRAAGCLANNPEWQGDAVEIQRQLRAEWDRPWDKEWGYD